MEYAYIIENSKASKTIELLKKVSEDNGIKLLKMPQNNLIKDLPILRYGCGDGFDLTKLEQLKYFEEIISNTAIIGDDIDNNIINDYDVVIVKNPTRVCLFKDVDEDINIDDDGIYKYIPDKTEWRINYSFGKVNSVFNKNLTPSTIFGKADITEWSVETNPEIRRILIDFTKKIGEKVSKDYPLLEHFGLDIIKDNITGKYYLLELNKAHSLNAEGCQYLIQGFKQKYFDKKDKELLINAIKNKYCNRLESLSSNDLRLILEDMNDWE